LKALSLNVAALQSLRPIFAPLAILFAAALAAAAGPGLPSSLSGLTVIGPYFVLALGTTISIWFNRGRAFITAASLLAAYSGYSLALAFGATSFAARATFAAVAILVPLNALLGLLFPERGVAQHRNYRWILVGIAEIACVSWIASAGRSALSGTSWHALLDHWLLRSPPTPVAGRLLFAAAFVLAALRAWPHGKSEARPVDIGLAAALLGFFLACEWATTPGVFGTFMTAAGIVLLVSILQESHRLAFRDELTGLPGRRALEERLSGLGPVFAVAMVDVDHFKRFNDTHGHDVGDQVLKLVAARLEQIEGGGKAFRYGGEEFCVLFPDRKLQDATPHLEKMRQSIETYKMAMRSPDRPKDPDAGSKLRETRLAEKTLSVTVSIGVAERSDGDATPGQAVRAADAALYRAKRGGRNRVSR
jgi:GGDEF domain-containing protein